MRDSFKHWYNEGERINHYGLVYTACRRMADAEKDCDLRNPTCPICRESFQRDEQWREELIADWPEID